MLNHARTLLGNRDLGAYVSSLWTIPAEAMDPRFLPVPLPQTLQVVDRVLFGDRPDATMLTQRLADLMTLLHTRALEPYVLALDRRISYDLKRHLGIPFGSTWTFLAGDRGVVPSLQRGDLPSPDRTGQCDWLWHLHRTGPSSAWVLDKITGSLATPEPVTDYLLPGSTYRVDLTELPEDSQMQLAVRLRCGSLASLYPRILSLPDDVVGSVLAGANPDFREMWETDNFKMKLGGFLLAYIYQLESRRG